MVVVPVIGTGLMMTILRLFWLAGNPRLHLYVNDYSPVLFSDVPDFVEAAYPGYGPQPVAGMVLTPLVNPLSFALIGDALTFSPTAAFFPRVRIFGYYVTQFLGGQILWAERLPKRLYFSGPADSLVVTPQIGAVTEFTG